VMIMKTTSIVGVWLLIVVGVLVETFFFYQDPGGYGTESVIGLIAALAAVMTMVFSMGLKDEDRAVRYMLLIPVALVAVLTVTMLFAYPVSF
jgi:hypothetical protein